MLAETFTSCPASDNRLRDRTEQAAREQLAGLGVGQVEQQRDELVAPQARDAVTLAQRRLHARRDHRSNWSPAWWPRVSLIALKPSRSM